MKELFGMFALLAILFVALKTEIPAKAIHATEAWLDDAGQSQ